MYLIIISMSILLSKAWGVEPTLYGNCDLAPIDACLAPINVDSSSPLGAPMSDAVLAVLCANLQNVKTCLNKAKTNCTKFQLGSQLSKIDTVEYICTEEGTKGLKASQICYAVSDFSEHVTECTRKISWLLENTDTNIVGNICKQSNAVYSCYVNASKNCNSEKFVTVVYKKIIEKQFDMYGCDIDFKNWESRAYSQCNITKLDECSPFIDDPDIFPFIKNPLDPKLFSITIYQFNRACSAVDNMIYCVTNNAKCEETNPIVQISLGTAKAFEYICKRDREGFDNLAKCYSRNTELITSCPYFKPTNCSTFLLLQKCLTDSVKKTCGNSTTIDQFFYKNYQPMLDQHLSCTLVSPMKLTVKNEANEIIQPFLIFFLFIYYLVNYI